MNKTLIGLLAAVLLAACSTTPTEPGGAPVDERNPSAGTPGASTSGSTSGSVNGNANAAGAMNPLRDPNNILSKRSVYFDFDSYAVKDDFKPMIEAHARYLQTHRDAHMTIEGNTDERGSREYNIALGQRRADAAKRMMTLLGAADAQIETVSFGKEKPKDPGHDESAWAENRRDDMVYRGE